MRLAHCGKNRHSRSYLNSDSESTSQKISPSLSLLNLNYSIRSTLDFILSLSFSVRLKYVSLSFSLSLISFWVSFYRYSEWVYTVVVAWRKLCRDCGRDKWAIQTICSPLSLAQFSASFKRRRGIFRWTSTDQKAIYPQARNQQREKGERKILPLFQVIHDWRRHSVAGFASLATNDTKYESKWWWESWEV